MGRRLATQAMRACRPAFVALLMSIVATVLAWHFAQEQVRSKDQVRFEGEAERLELAMVAGLRECEVLLRSAQGLFAASKSVERDEWKAFVGNYVLKEHCPGMLAMTFIANVPAAQYATFLAQTRSDGAPEFTIWPAGERDHYYPCKYAEPLDPTTAVLGGDIGTMPLRAAALELARDSELATLSPRLQLGFDEASAAIGLYVPVYRRNESHGTVEQRRTAIEGWIAAPIKMSEFMTGILSRIEDNISVQVRDGTGASGSELLYDSHPEQRAEGVAASPLSRHTTITIGGRKWIVSSAALPSFLASSDKVTPGLVLLCGLVLSGLLLSMMVRRQLEADRMQAEASSRAKSEFLANMSHEIRTPMTSILGYTDLLLDPAQSAAERAACLQTIRRNGNHLIAILNDILDISKIESGKLEVELLRCSPIEIVMDIASFLRPRATEKNLQFDVVLATPVPETILTDPTRLRQILFNLLGNAMKFTDIGSVQLVMRQTKGPGDRPQLAFDVIDTGAGLTKEQAARLFQPFVQAEASTTRKFGGSGLGLTISLRLARLLGGDITVTSTPDAGSTFSVTIDTGPIGEVKMVTDTGVVRSDQPEGRAAKLARITGRILLAEDAPDNQRLISHHLRGAGAEVSIAPNGVVACLRVDEATKAQRPFDLVLMDMQMPLLDGYAATARLRASGYAGPIIALTANAMAGDRDRCMESGCSDYATKPIDRRELLSLVHRHLAQPVGGTADGAAAPRGDPTG